MAKREGVASGLRRKVSARDHHSCKKCGRRYEHLEVHHIKPVRERGEDTLENTVLLCWACHREWESIESDQSLPFAAWLPLPTARRLLSMLTQAQAWPEEITAAQMREALLLSGGFIRALWASEQHPTDPDYEPDENDIRPYLVKRGGYWHFKNDALPSESALRATLGE